MTVREITLDEKIAFLRDPQSYAETTASVECVETHFAWVFLTEHRAYKLKKPVQHERMDYRTLAAREQGCREEVRLNRRLAPSVYECVVPLSRRGEALTIGTGDSVEDWLVQMERLPSARMLDQVLKHGTVSSVELDRVAQTLVDFFEHTIRCPVDSALYLKQQKARVEENLKALSTYGAALDQQLASEVTAAQLEFVERASTMLGARGAHVVEGHGDLRAEHVYLGPPVAVIDCLEFDRSLRLLDPAEEMALLALEIEQLGHAQAAQELLARYGALSAHPPQPMLLDYYESQRATTRAKLAAWHLGDPQFPDPKPWIARVQSNLSVAASRARRALLGIADLNVGAGGSHRGVRHRWGATFEAGG